ncbi:hypothetical protein ACFC1R_21095 [Kitasatospora sp. NPDC056138]
MVDAVVAFFGHAGPQASPDEITAYLTRAAHELLARIPPPPASL